LKSMDIIWISEWYLKDIIRYCRISNALNYNKSSPIA
jgi:hypothetical protein